jgi:hypothetical protein
MFENDIRTLGLIKVGRRYSGQFSPWSFQDSVRIDTLGLVA